MDELSEIITTNNRKEILKECLRRLSKQNYRLSVNEIVIVNDCSTDGTMEFVQTILHSSQEEIHYYSQSNKGPVAAHNLGIRQAKGGYCHYHWR